MYEKSGVEVTYWLTSVPGNSAGYIEGRRRPSKLRAFADGRKVFAGAAEDVVPK